MEPIVASWLVLRPLCAIQRVAEVVGMLLSYFTSYFELH